MDVLNKLAGLVHEGAPLKSNQYLYKAILIDAMLQMN